MNEAIEGLNVIELVLLTFVMVGVFIALKSMGIMDDDVETVECDVDTYISNIYEPTDRVLQLTGCDYVETYSNVHIYKDMASNTYALFIMYRGVLHDMLDHMTVYSRSDIDDIKEAIVRLYVDDIYESDKMYLPELDELASSSNLPSCVRALIVGELYGRIYVTLLSDSRYRLFTWFDAFAVSVLSNSASEVKDA